jgi:hypothetical protein
MAVVLPDTRFGARVARRLHEDMTAWLTLTDQAGTPQPAPVWFLWDDDSSCVVLYSQAPSPDESKFAVLVASQ